MTKIYTLFFLSMLMLCSSMPLSATPIADEDPFAGYERKAVMELENVTPQMNSATPIENLNQVDFDITARYTGYPDMQVRGYDAALLAPAGATAAEAKNKAGIFAKDGAFVEPITVTLDGNHARLTFTTLPDGQYKIMLPSGLFYSEPTSDGCILTNPPMSLPYNVAKPYVPESISVVGNFNGWKAGECTLTYDETINVWDGALLLPEAGTYGIKFTDGETYWSSTDLVNSGTWYQLSQSSADGIGGMVISVGKDLLVHFRFIVNTERIARFTFTTSTPDGISLNPHCRPASHPVFMLDGRVAGTTAKRGLFIQNGKKVMM